LNAVTSRIRREAAVVEHHRKSGHALADRLPSLVRRCEPRDRVGDVSRRDLADRPIAEYRQDPAEGRSVLDARRLAHVDARRLPPLSQALERRRRRRSG
jgi:hypothetical protein